ncbi:glycosyltransferase family 92 protein [Methylobacterium sp. J-048]|uniref:glycosyltransferase family 2 protein n=1 Tax=Methylobacterium sp. J-048 TaxID=2836635 RepID=UPI001FB90A44|nr:glycosyltransferase family 2 protein [Methylobacterium sp. J-048]MCJ2057258.1 glycosyltransferase family 92 protein [Methylobacterium sp. J-048]
MKPYRAGIVAIAKNENPYLLEWLAYHLALGFEHIWVYDNDSDESLSRLVAKEARRHVTFVRWPNAPDGRTQINAYNHYLRTFGGTVEWTAVLDLDEMICLKQHRTILDFVRDFEGATGIAINWRFFGSSGHVRQTGGLMMERFRRACHVGDEINEGVKSLHRTDTVALLMPHYALYRDREHVVSAKGARVPNDWCIKVDGANFEVAQINHYFVKSSEEWQAKIRRHYRYSSDDREGYFEKLDRNEVEDVTILAHLDETRAWIRRLARKPSRLDAVKAALRLARKPGAGSSGPTQPGA